MGAFFESIHVRTENADMVQKTLQQVAKVADYKFLLGPALNGWISVFPNDGGQSDRISLEIAKHLPNDIFHLVVHDDDIFFYYFYRAGRLVDQYNSDPDSFEEASEEEKQKCRGRPELFQELLCQPKSLGKLKSLLTADKYTFESERMAQFVKLLGLSNALSSYDYLQSEDRDEDEIQGWEQFIHIENQPESAEDYNNRGVAKQAKGDLDGALADFNKAIALDSALVAAYKNRDLVGRAKADRDVTLAETWSKYGSVKKAEGDLDHALASYNRAIELNPEFAEAFNNRGRIKKTKTDLAGALADFNRAIELKPDLATAYSNRGGVKKANGDLEGALADYNRAIELKPDMAAAYNNRADAKQIKGDLDGALADFNRAIELKPDSAQIHKNRGDAKRAKGDLDGALADYNKAIELKPNLIAAYNNRALVKQVKGDLDGALADFNRAIEFKPDSAQIFNNRSALKKAKGDLDGAKADHAKAIELKPGTVR